MQVAGPASTQFPEAIPLVYTPSRNQPGFDVPQPIDIICEAQHIGEAACAPSLQPPKRAGPRDVGHQPRPSGDGAVGETLGRVLNVIGEPVDKMGPCAKSVTRFTARLLLRRAVDRAAMFETGIRVIDLIEPYLRGGKIGLFGGAGVGKTVIIQS